MLMSLVVFQLFLFILPAKVDIKFELIVLRTLRPVPLPRD